MDRNTTINNVVANICQLIAIAMIIYLIGWSPACNNIP